MDLLLVQLLYGLILLAATSWLLLRRRRSNATSSSSSSSSSWCKQLPPPPGPPGLPVLGHLHLLGKAPHRVVEEWVGQYGPLVQLRFGAIPTVVVSDPEAVEEIFNKHAAVTTTRPRPMTAAMARERRAFCTLVVGVLSAVVVIGKDLITNGGLGLGMAEYGEYWKQLRRIMHMHLLSKKQLQRSEARIKTEARQLAQRILEGSRNGDMVNPALECTLATSNVMWSFIFGRRHEKTDQEFLDMSSATEHIFEGIASATGLADYIPWLAFLPNKKLRELAVWKSKFENVSYTPIVSDNIDSTKKRFTKGSPVTTFAEHLLSVQDEERLTDEQVMLLCSAVIIAGTDTTSTTLRYCLPLLASYPDTQRSLQEELENVVGVKRLPNDEDFGSMPLLHSFIKEALRYKPIHAFGIPHATSEDIEVMGHSIKKGSQLLMNNWSLMRSAKHWDEPDKFKPQRFLHEGAQTELLLLLAYVIRCFHITTPDGKPVDLNEIYGISLVPELYELKFVARIGAEQLLAQECGADV
eukprot:jgi/Chlat1/7519/Chrsp61S07011